MIRNLYQYCLLVLLISTIQTGFAQYVVKGKILDESNMGIPFADIYVKNHPDLRTRADINGNYLMRLEVGEYQMVFSALGYESRERFIIVREKVNTYTIRLFPIRIKDLQEVSITAEKRNVGRDIVLKTVNIKNQLDYNQYAYSCDVYLRAKNQKQEEEEEEEVTQKQEDQTRNKNMVEVEMTRNYKPPNHIREIRTAYSKRGKDKYLYFTTTAKANFNFFRSTLYLNDLSKNPIQSPISTAGILSYKYQLVAKIKREGKPELYKIKITPRNIATSTLDGYLWIEDSTWMVKKLKFTISKGNLLFYDQFSIEEVFDLYGDTLCVLKSQKMTYGVSYREVSFSGSTIVNYKNYDFNPNFKAIDFSNEVAVTTKKAYQRDSSYWIKKRMTPLTRAEQEFIEKKDSIQNLYTKKSYLDSIDSVFNKITFWEVVWFGIDHRNRAKKTQWTLSSIAAMIRPIYIAGPRVGPDINIFKKWDNENTLNAFVRADVGIMNWDAKGWTNINYLYNPFKQSTVGLNLTHNYALIRNYDAITQILLRDNFIVRNSATLKHSFEVFNGFYFESNLSYINRSPLPEDTRFIHWLDDVLDNNQPPKFKEYNALITNLNFSYTPGQKYMREPKRKVILGSKWPTLFANFEIGIPQLIGSKVDYSYLKLGLHQTFKIGTVGTSKYRMETGKFLSSKNLHAADYQYQRRSDPLFFSNPLHSYQNLDSTLPTVNWYLETHYIHHFNGAIINKIPFMKKTRISVVAGGGYLWVPELDWEYYEAFVGLERIFKFARRRLRIGVYATFADGNHIDPRGQFKISFAILNERDMKFNF